MKKSNRKMSFGLAFAAVLGLVGTSAIAGKAEREWMKTKVKPAMVKSVKEYKTACGCNLKIIPDPKLKTQDELNQIRNVSNSISREVGKYCTDKESKQAVCKMKTLKVSKAEETEFKFSGSTGSAFTDGHSYVSFDMITDVIDE